jgi:hypothetical protein
LSNLIKKWYEEQIRRQRPKPHGNAL